MTLHFCATCSRYTLAATCPACKAATTRPGPARFNPADPYGAYRRRLKLLARGDAHE